QGKRHREIPQGIGGQQQGVLTQVEFIDAQGAREMGQGPTAVGSAIELSRLPVEAVVEEAVGQVVVEVTPEGALDLPEAHAILKDAVEDSLTDLVVVVCLGLDALDLGAEGGAAVAGGPVFGGGDVREE